jgi:hypothetical protein
VKLVSKTEVLVATSFRAIQLMLKRRPEIPSGF